MIQIQMSTAQQDVLQMCQWLLSLAVPDFFVCLFLIFISAPAVLGRAHLKPNQEVLKEVKK